MFLPANSRHLSPPLSIYISRSTSIQSNDCNDRSSQPAQEEENVDDEATSRYACKRYDSTQITSSDYSNGHSQLIEVLSSNYNTRVAEKKSSNDLFLANYLLRIHWDIH